MQIYLEILWQKKNYLKKYFLHMTVANIAIKTIANNWNFIVAQLEMKQSGDKQIAIAVDSHHCWNFYIKYNGAILSLVECYSQIFAVWIVYHYPMKDTEWDWSPFLIVLLAAELAQQMFKLK